VNANSIGHDLNFGRTSYSPVAASPATKSDWPEDSGAGPEQAPAQSDEVTAPF